MLIQVVSYPWIIYGFEKFMELGVGRRLYGKSNEVPVYFLCKNLAVWLFACIDLRMISPRL